MPLDAPDTDRLARQLIMRFADKWTLLLLDVLEERGTLRFSEIARAMPDISQKMLTQTLRQMERDGLLTRRIHPVVPPRVDYDLTPLGRSLGAAFCGVWLWAAEHGGAVEAARRAYDAGS